MKNLSPRDHPPQEVPIILDQMTRDEWNFELERASDRIEDGLVSTYRGYRSLFIKLSKLFIRFRPSKRVPIERYLKRRVIFPLLVNLQFKGSYHLLEKFAHELLYTAVKNFSIKAQIQEAKKRVEKEINREDDKKVIKRLFGRSNGNGGYGKAA